MNHPKDHFECLGYYEELLDVNSYKFYGSRDVEKQDRPLGHAGRKTIILHGAVRVKGIKRDKILNFKTPTPVYSTLQMYCGKMHNPINKL